MQQRATQPARRGQHNYTDRRYPPAQATSRRPAPTRSAAGRNAQGRPVQARPMQGRNGTGRPLSGNNGARPSSGGRGRRGGNPHRRIIGAIVLVALIAVLWYALDTMIIGIGTPRFYNVYVNGVSLRGYTHDEGVALFDTIEEEWQNKSYELYYGDDSWTFSPATVSAQLNVDTVLERAWNYGRVGSLSYRKSQIKSLNSNPYYFESDITYDESQLEAFIASIHEAVDTEPVNAEAAAKM